MWPQAEVYTGTHLLLYLAQLPCNLVGDQVNAGVKAFLDILSANLIRKSHRKFYRGIRRTVQMAWLVLHYTIADLCAVRLWKMFAGEQGQARGADAFAHERFFHKGHISHRFEITLRRRMHRHSRMLQAGKAMDSPLHCAGCRW